MNRFWPDGRIAQLVVILVMLAVAGFAYRGAHRNPAIRVTPPVLLQPVAQGETHGVSAADTRAGQLPPLNRELVVMTDSDMQRFRESRQDMINRPPPM